MPFHIKALSHRKLGKYLAEQYLLHAPQRYIFAFLLGCTEPDKNPATYLKGSISNQWLRGHNWESSRQYIRRLADRLENRRKLRLLDFYAMGKLIHYTADAFTSTHNRSFRSGLRSHRHYEANLQAYFLTYLSAPQFRAQFCHSTVMDTIYSSHRLYSRFPSSICTDAHFSVAVSSAILCLLLTGRTSDFTLPAL